MWCQLRLRHCLHSPLPTLPLSFHNLRRTSNLMPWIILICFKKVDFPLSPAPSNKSFTWRLKACRSFSSILSISWLLYLCSISSGLNFNLRQQVHDHVNEPAILQKIFFANHPPHPQPFLIFLPVNVFFFFGPHDNQNKTHKKPSTASNLRYFFAVAHHEFLPGLEKKEKKKKELFSLRWRLRITGTFFFTWGVSLNCQLHEQQVRFVNSCFFFISRTQRKWDEMQLTNVECVGV